jgi:hypothetical protein
MRWLTERAREAAGSLPHGSQHSLILVGMIASYLSDPQAHTAELEPIVDAVIGAAGPLMGPALLVFRMRRLAERGSRAGGGSPIIGVAPDAPATPASAWLDNFG